MDPDMRGGGASQPYNYAKTRELLLAHIHEFTPRHITSRPLAFATGRAMPREIEASLLWKGCPRYPIDPKKNVMLICTQFNQKAAGVNPGGGFFDGCATMHGLFPFLHHCIVTGRPFGWLDAVPFLGVWTAGEFVARSPEFCGKSLLNALGDTASDFCVDQHLVPLFAQLMSAYPGKDITSVVFGRGTAKPLVVQTLRKMTDDCRTDKELGNLCLFSFGDVVWNCFFETAISAALSEDGRLVSPFVKCLRTMGMTLEEAHHSAQFQLRERCVALGHLVCVCVDVCGHYVCVQSAKSWKKFAKEQDVPHLAGQLHFLGEKMTSTYWTTATPITIAADLAKKLSEVRYASMPDSVPPSICLSRTFTGRRGGALHVVRVSVSVIVCASVEGRASRMCLCVCVCVCVDVSVRRLYLTGTCRPWPRKATPRKASPFTLAR